MTDATTLPDLANSGFATLNDADPTKRATLMVLGVARSGTSMAAAALSGLGVHLGDKALNAVREDAEIADAIENRNRERLSEIVARYDAAHDIWGFKRPEAFRKLTESLPVFRNPRMIVAFRDPVAIAGRNAVSMRIDFTLALENAVAMTARLTRFVSRQTCPMFVFSYEKAMSSPDAFLNALIGFCGLAPDADARRSALAAIGGDRTAYLSESRIWYEGALESVSAGVAHGWARRMPGDKPCKVEIVSAGQVIGRGSTAPASGVALDARRFEIALASAPTEHDVEARIARTTERLAKSTEFSVT